MCGLETEGLNLKKRKAETLIEVVVAMAVFGVIMSGITDFMAEQTKNVARIIDKDAILYNAPKILEEYYRDNTKTSGTTDDGTDFKFLSINSSTPNTIQLTKGENTIEIKFSL